MALVKGLNVQKSKFAALSIDSLSDDSEDGGLGWHEVKPPTSGKLKPREKQKQGGGAVHEEGARPLSKNAKKRARKKRNQTTLSESSDSKDPDSASRLDPDSNPLGLDQEQEMRMRNQAAADLEFQRDLERAILQSKSDAEQHIKLLEDSRTAERLALTASVSTPTKTGSKKGVTLSLQQFHRGTTHGTQKSSSMDPNVQLSEIAMDDPLPETPVTPDTHFFDRLSETVNIEVHKEDSKKAERRLSESHQEPTEDDLPRIAQLKDNLEKRDVLIDKLRKQNELLKKTLKEVKQRNQSLCKILSQGEFSTKAHLIEQIDQLTTIKNDLTEEVETLHSALEQERSKNKSLKVELGKVLAGSSKSSK